MSSCKHAETCSFFNESAGVMASGERLMDEYCRGNFNACDRFYLAESFGIEKVPEHLLPINLNGSVCGCGE
ncbi:MAG TPA: hypothetical protein VJ550_03630 [Geomonas sp.]|nr:hypothetical protein [Geomonas sp.]